MQRKRYQKGSLSQQRGKWIAQWREDGRRKKRTLGTVTAMTRSAALSQLAAIVAPLNEPPAHQFGAFVDDVYLPLFRQKWKASSAAVNEQRVRKHFSHFGKRSLQSITRAELQRLLDDKARKGLSFSMIGHLRWDLKQIFDVAVAEGLLERNPAVLLFVPRGAARAPKRQLTWEQVRSLFPCLALRERVIVSLALVVGMRPGEILALQWRHCRGDSITVEQRVYRGCIDTPKTANSFRECVVPKGVKSLMEQWLHYSPLRKPDDWVFPSERGSTPLSRDNCLRRDIRPQLRAVGLEWVTFQVLRRTHASLMRELDVDPKLVADQLGHTLDVNLNVYTKTAPQARLEALENLESRLNGAHDSPDPVLTIRSKSLI